MRWFHDLKIGTKLIGGFCIVIALGVGGFLNVTHTLHSYMQEVNTTGALCQQAVSKAREASLASNTMARETMAYVYTAEQAHWDAKKAADDEAAHTFDELKSLLQKLPNNQALLSALETAFTQDDQNCNPLEDQTMDLAKAGKVESAKKLFDEKYVPARAELESRIHNLIGAVEKYAQSVQEASTASADRAVLLGWACQGLILSVSMALSLFLVRAITFPIKQVSERLESLRRTEMTGLRSATSALAQGDLTSAIQTGTTPIEAQHGDEVGVMAGTFNAMLDQIRETVGAFQEAQRSLQGLVGEVAESAEMVAATSAQLSTSANQTGQAANEIARTIQEVAGAADQSATTSQEMARGSEQQARSATEAAGAMQRLESAVTQVLAGGGRQQEAAQQANGGMQQAAQAVQQVAASAQQMASTAQQAASVAQTGGRAVEQTIESMARIKEQVQASSEVVRELGQKGQEIGAIVETIDQIAEQTNLLALNAAIEAARAGEHGKGFAVVADEVRKLAERATAATKEISTLIGSVRSGVEEAVRAMESSGQEVQEGAIRSEEAGTALHQILAAAQSVASQVQTVTATAQEMAAAVQSVQTSVETVCRISEENEQAVDEMAAGAAQVSASITTVASISQETAAGAEQMSASAEEVSASAQNVSAAVQEQTAGIEEVSAAAHELSSMAARLQGLVGRFRLEEESKARPSLRMAA